MSFDYIVVLGIRGNNYIVFFLFGLVAGVASLSLSIFLKLTIDGLFIPEIASQGLISITSGEIESQAVLTLGPLAKYSTIIGAIVVNVLLYGIIGIIIGKLFMKMMSPKFAIKSILSTFISYIILIILTIVFLVLGTTPGQSISIPVKSFVLFLFPSVVYGLIFAFLFGNKNKKIDLVETRSNVGSVINKSNKTADIDYSKRDMIRALIISVIAIPLVYFGFNRLISGSEQQQQQPRALDQSIQQFLQSKSKPPGFENPILTPLVDAEVTPTFIFYRIDINTVVPTINTNDWNLTIKGLVDNPVVINYAEFRGMNSVEEFATLTCISNKIGGNLVSTALWKGVRLRDLLSKAGVQSSVKYIVFRCSDGYDVGIPLENGMMDSTILAYDMNNSPLTSEHGYPVRAIVPGFYGMMNPKWITEIELVDKTYEGFWQRKGWTNDGIKNIYSSVVIPGNQPINDRFPNLVPNSSFLNGKNIPIAGIAFAGDRGISKVEVSVDGGTTWKTAIVKDPLSQYTWVLWTSGFTAADKGNYKIIVRATDKTGQVQTSELEQPFPNGAGGYNQIDISV
ncbi:molybdopterin-dependent oxidoreductase [Candidatus Nitrosocosmicus arcticus]|uniref:Putative Oxidoreductase molybdopterin binding protein n=1 Tax=Candidatus Nitrosocosmicus arcticus TaxID=2035267 RepID=A0A557SXF4_9ARCH|nr:molybdopterin-dependent oxidoreductase [Candidatus Nitrosocosmicus arcticus]TVP41289.1 putative Oxidoreductase molybdopterin binding protein [Candidatus Nitrosocosmicus arcticus]